MDIVYEDEYIIVVEKPENTPVQSDKSKDVDMVSMLRYYLKKTSTEKDEYYIGLVHRLDRPVSGLMVFAKTKETNALLSEQIRLGMMKKIYIAKVCGQVPQNGKLEDWLLKDPISNMSFVVNKGTNGAKFAKLEYSLIETKIENEQTISKIMINLISGRHHQIRVQFANNNTPIVGDTKYNKSISGIKGFVKLALHSNELGFVHPITKKHVTFKSTKCTL
jgi:23S rRNA pseudouridine1911/1915/1917 synthase